MCCKRSPQQDRIRSSVHKLSKLPRSDRGWLPNPLLHLQCIDNFDVRLAQLVQLILPCLLSEIRTSIPIVSRLCFEDFAKLSSCLGERLKRGCLKLPSVSDPPPTSEQKVVVLIFLMNNLHTIEHILPVRSLGNVNFCHHQIQLGTVCSACDFYGTAGRWHLEILLNCCRWFFTLGKSRLRRGQRRGAVSINVHVRWPCTLGLSTRR
mmetsp:Transcript_33010/g.72118  ORF Transcript_33010/g.72118 Transcript_33010/m.72118 type:complete len:207 (+) Transcript_33010:1671-2291(+)